MKTSIKNTLMGLFFLGSIPSVSAQCPNNNIQFGTSTAPSTVGVTTTLSSCLYGGEYRLVTNMQAGSQYSFETCGDTDFDTQITVYNANTGSLIAYNDDFCGLQSKVTFTSNGDNVRVLIDRYNCGSQSTCMTLRATRETGGAPAPDPCNSITALTCGSTGIFNLSGSGAWNPPGPWGTPGAEQVFSFTPLTTGVHSIAVNNNSFYVDLFIKSGSCGSTGWTYIDDISSFGTANNNVTLNAGVTYYFLIDDENTSPSSGTISISCPNPAANPCNNITNISSCGSSASFNLSGGGAWNPPGPWGTPGEEAVFSFTPSVSGAYPIQVTNSGFYVDLFFKTGSCSSSGWTYINDIFSNETSTVNLIAGVTYLFLIDDENTSPSSGTISIGCPCVPPPGGIDGSFTYAGDFTISGTTIGACNDCNLRPSNDRVYEIVIPCASTYSFSTCGSANWDTYLYLRDAACGGSLIALNDDACGLQSNITVSLLAGTYYLHVEGFSSLSQGDFDLTVSNAAPCNLSVSTTADIKNCGFNISCNGDSDGSITASANGCNVSYTWSNGATGQTASGLSAGNYTVIATDLFGCSASSSVILTEPDPLEVDAGSDQIVYYGYTPMECADLSGTATGGCPNYSYSWSSGDNTPNATVCPQVSTDYSLEVSDENGCIASDTVRICAVDVICYAGNSNVQKVEICHIPPGNPGNPQSLCVNANSVPAHLNNGAQLGACGEVQQICGATSSLNMNSRIVHEQIELVKQEPLTIYPNPFEQTFTVVIDSDKKGLFQISVLDASGRDVKEIYYGYHDGMHKNFEVLNTHISPGMYLVKVTLNNEVIATETLIKQ